MGTDEGLDNCLVSGKPIPLAKLTPELVRERVEAAVAVKGPRPAFDLDPDAARDFLDVARKQRQWDADPERCREVNLDPLKEQS